MRLLALAEDGQADAQNALAARLATGYFVKPDQSGALYWYAQAVRAGYTHAKWNAGTMLINGEGIDSPERVLGMELIEQAAKAGEMAACQLLSDCFEKGICGKPVDMALSQYWRGRASSHSEFEEFGVGVELESLGIQLTKRRIEFQ